jgi:carbamoyl-phosphate synthase large subunit
VVDYIINGDIDWIINTPLGASSKFDERAIRRTALERALPTMTTLAAAQAAVSAIRAMRESELHVISLQEYHEGGGA